MVTRAGRRRSNPIAFSEMCETLVADEASTQKASALGKRKRKEPVPRGKPKEASTFLHDPSSIADSFSSSASMFVLFIQENYLNMFSSIDSVAEASAILSDADVMMTAEVKKKINSS